MDDGLADLVLEHGVDLFPYLQMRAKYAKAGKNGVVVVRQADYTMETLDLFRDSGFIRYDYSHDSMLVSVTLREDGRWLTDPPEVRKYTRKEKEEYIPKELEALCEMVGYPVDWATKLGKYRSLFFSLTASYDMDIIFSVAEFMRDNEPEWTVTQLLTKSFFKQTKTELDKEDNSQGDLRYASRVKKNSTEQGSW